MNEWVPMSSWIRKETFLGFGVMSLLSSWTEKHSPLLLRDCYAQDRHRVQLGDCECEGGSSDAYLDTADAGAECYVFITGLRTTSFHLSYLPISRSTSPYHTQMHRTASFLSLIHYHPNLWSTLVLSSGALLIPLSVAVPLSPCTIHRLTKRWYCRPWTMSPLPCYFTRSSPSAVYKDVLIAA